MHQNSAPEGFKVWQTLALAKSDNYIYRSARILQPCKTINSFGTNVEKTAFLNDLQDKLAKLLKNSPAADIERNIKTLVSQGLTKFELVTREEFEVQRELQARLRSRVDALEARVKELENKRPI